MLVGLGGFVGRFGHPLRVPVLPFKASVVSTRGGIMVTANDVSFRRTFQGAWELATVTGGLRVARAYMGWSKRDALRQFLTEVNALS